MDISNKQKQTVLRVALCGITSACKRLFLSEQHLRSLEGRRRSEKDGAFALSDTLPRKRNAAAVTPQFSCATLGRSFPNKVRVVGRRRWRTLSVMNSWTMATSDFLGRRFFTRRATRPLCRAPAVAASFPGFSPCPARKAMAGV